MKACSGSRARYSLNLCDRFPASKFDGREDTNRSRLNRGRSPKKGGLRTRIQMIGVSAPPIPRNHGRGCACLAHNSTLSIGAIAGHVASDVRRPNITGRAQIVCGNLTCFGAFEGKSPTNVGIDSGTGGSIPGLNLSASLSSDLYGRAQTTQPASIRLIPCIRF